MSKELTLEIMKAYGLKTSPEMVLAFIVESALSPTEESILKTTINKMYLPDDLLFKSMDDLKAFYDENEEVIQIDFKRFIMYFKELPERLDKAKRGIDGYEKLLRLVPIEFLNKYTLVYLIEKTMNSYFWKDRVTSTDNKRVFVQKYGEEAMAMSAILPNFGTAPVSYEDAKRAYESAGASEDKVLALKYLINYLSDGRIDEEYYEGKFSEQSIDLQLEELGNYYAFLTEKELGEPEPDSEAAMSKVEAVELKGTTDREVISDAWANGLMYDGEDLFETYTNDSNNKELHEEAKFLVEDSDIQECYLGYIPSLGLFVSGFDGWYTESESDDEEEEVNGNHSPAVFFKINNGKVDITKSEVLSKDGMWYQGKEDGGYAIIKKRHPDIVDIRLD